ncbi:MAG: tRNA (guanosine(46)-N7)-methyltransferase TrmB [Bacilli bacterium]
MKKVSGLLAKTNRDGSVDIMSTFNTIKPLFLEIGCGKGAFATELSRRNPDISIIAVERVPDVLMMAMEKSEREGCKNIAFFCENADKIDILFKEKSVCGLYLNFSDPWPRKKHAKRRLTSPLFLEKYKRILKNDAKIFFKTDNTDFFEYSLQTFKKSGFRLNNVCYDLHSSPFGETNIETEFETNFSAQGYKIKYLEAIID